MDNTPILVRTAVVLYIPFALWALYSLWKNPAGPSSLQNAGILLAALLPALIAILPLRTTTELKNEFNLVIFFDEQSKQVAQTGLFSPYLRAYHSLYVTDDPSDLVSREIEAEEVPQDSAKQYWPVFHKEKGLDLIERLVLKSFIIEFPSRWDIEYKSIQTPTGTTRTGSSETRQLSTTIPTKTLYQMLKHNQLFEGNLTSFQQRSFAIPHNSSFSIRGGNGSRTISIEVPDVGGLMTISISPSQASEAHGGVWGVFKSNSSLAVLEYRTVIKFKYRPNAIGSEDVKNWFNNVSSAIARLDWETIDSEVERSLMRKMLVNQE